jgi:nicotinamidase-related amidase
MRGTSPIQSRYVAPDFRDAALLTIDLQHDFLDNGSAPIAGTSAVLSPVAALVASFRRTNRPVVHVVRVYKDDGSNVDLCRRAEIEGGRRIVSPHTPGMELASELMTGQGQQLDATLLLSGALQVLGPFEWAMYKPRWGAFYQTGLERHLRELGVTTLVVAGCNFPNCPRASIYEASERDFRVVVAADAVSGIYDRGLQELTNIGVAGMRAQDICLAVDGTRSKWSHGPGSQTILGKVGHDRPD